MLVLRLQLNPFRLPTSKCHEVYMESHLRIS